MHSFTKILGFHEKLEQNYVPVSRKRFENSLRLALFTMIEWRRHLGSLQMLIDGTTIALILVCQEATRKTLSFIYIKGRTK